MNSKAYPMMARPVPYGIYFPGIPSLASMADRVRQADSDRRLFQTPLGVQLARRAAAVLTHRLDQPIEANALAAPDRVARLASHELDPYEHIRHLTRNAISYYHLQQTIPCREPEPVRPSVLLCGRSMGLLSAMAAAACVTFEDGVYIAAHMARFHRESYADAEVRYISRKLYDSESTP